MSRKKPPLLRVSMLTGTPMILTRYTTDANSVMIAHERYPISDEDFERAIKDYRYCKRRQKKRSPE